MTVFFFTGTPVLVLTAFHRLADVLPSQPNPPHQSQSNSCSAAATAAFASAKIMAGKADEEGVAPALVRAQPEERSPEESNCHRSSFRSKGCCKTKRPMQRRNQGYAQSHPSKGPRFALSTYDPATERRQLPTIVTERLQESSAAVRCLQRVFSFLFLTTAHGQS